MLIYMVRHGESADDLSDSYGGIADFRLTEHGRKQARSAGQNLAGSGIQAIYCSPLARACESAEIIGPEIGDPPVEIVHDLRERNTFGVFSGHSRERARELFGYLLDPLDPSPGTGHECMPGGEEYAPFIDRVRRAFEDVVERATAAGYDSIAILTHRRFTLGLFTEVLGLGQDYPQDHCSVNLVEYHPARLVG